MEQKSQSVTMNLVLQDIKDIGEGWNWCKGLIIGLEWQFTWGNRSKVGMSVNIPCQMTRRTLAHKNTYRMLGDDLHR
jgi:hypothetical protein